MKITSRALVIAILLVVSTQNVSAYDFEVDGIYYNITNTTNQTVMITRGDNNYSGEVVIPSTIEYQGKTYTVTSIEPGALYGCLNIVVAPTSKDTSTPKAIFLLDDS